MWMCLQLHPHPHEHAHMHPHLHPHVHLPQHLNRQLHICTCNCTCTRRQMHARRSHVQTGVLAQAPRASRACSRSCHLLPLADMSTFATADVATDGSPPIISTHGGSCSQADAAAAAAEPLKREEDKLQVRCGSSGLSSLWLQPAVTPFRAFAPDVRRPVQSGHACSRV